MKKWNLALVSALCVMILAARALAAEGGESVVTATGTATMPRRPDVMRLRVEVSAEGKTMKDALAKMTERRSAVKKKLADLGAAEGAIEFGDVKEAAANQNENPMQRMMRMQRGGRKPAPAKDAPKPVKVAMTVKAEWPIKGGSPDEVLATVHELQEKVRAADVGESKKMTPEQQEEAEENNVSFDMGGEQPAAPGEPVFLFVSKISAEDRDKALASAFAKARDGAQQLAKAAGTQIGNLRQINVTSAPAYNEYAAAWQRYQAAFGVIQESYAGGSGEMNEVVAPTPDGMSFKVMVTAAFALK